MELETEKAPASCRGRLALPAPATPFHGVAALVPVRAQPALFPRVAVAVVDAACDFGERLVRVLEREGAPAALVLRRDFERVTRSLEIAPRLFHVGLLDSPVPSLHAALRLLIRQRRRV